MATKTSSGVKPAARSPRLPAPHPKTSPVPVLKQPVPAASVAKAKTAFKNFSLSKFAGKPQPINYVAARQSPAAVQQRMIAQTIDNLNNATTSNGNNATTSNRAMTLALPDAAIKQLLPSFDQKARTIDLGELINVIEQNMPGTELYANGNPTLNRLSIQAQVQNIIDTVKRDAKK